MVDPEINQRLYCLRSMSLGNLLLILLLVTKVDSFTFQKNLSPKSTEALITLGMIPQHSTPSSASQLQHTTTAFMASAAAAMDLTSSTDLVFDRYDALLPYFQVGNGLLSPQTVKKLDDKARISNNSNSAIYLFLDTYKKCGPMACLPMLSDPQVLPHLTRALRESYGSK
jgi:hypothetical protein